MPDSGDEAGPSYGVKNANLDDVNVMTDKSVAPLPKRWISSEVSIDDTEGVARKGGKYA